MVCVPCNVNTPAARLLSGYPHPPPFCGGARLSLHELICRHGGLPALEAPCRRRRRSRSRRHVLHLRCDVSATGANSAPANFNPPQPPQQQRQQLKSSLFPGGFRRPEIRVPTVVLRVDAADVLRSKGAIDEAVSRGFVGIVLLSGGDDSGGQLYEAACALGSVVRDRAYFLIAERVDVAAAVGASGVVLSDQGLPIIVARNMLMNSRADSVLLPIVARDVQTAFGAMTAAASEEDEPREKSLVAGFSKLDDKEIKLIEAERSILLEAIAVIRKAAPLVIF